MESVVEIKPHGNDQKWQVTGALNEDTCSADIDFNVPGKPNPPPVKLRMTLSRASQNFKEGAIEKATFEFTDPSGKLAPPCSVLNAWVELGGSKKQEAPLCPEFGKSIFADIAWWWQEVSHCQGLEVDDQLYQLQSDMGGEGRSWWVLQCHGEFQRARQTIATSSAISCSFLAPEWLQPRDENFIGVHRSQWHFGCSRLPVKFLDSDG